MSRMQMVAVAKDLQAKAAQVPLTRAARPEEGGLRSEYFARVDKELSWGLTLNK